MFLETLKARSAAMDSGLGQPRFGKVQSFDPNSYAARVLWLPEGANLQSNDKQPLSGWLPVLSPLVGSGWGIAAPVSPGDIVLVVAQEGYADHGVIVGRIYNDKALPPKDADDKPAPSGEFWLVHKNGSSFKVLNNGTVTMNGSVDIAFTSEQIDLTVSGGSKTINLSAAGGTVNVSGANINLGTTVNIA